jgi:triacylglycerol lipase
LHSCYFPDNCGNNNCHLGVFTENVMIPSTALNVPGYSPRIALWLLQVAHLTYQTPAEIIAKTQAWGFPYAHFFDQGDTQACLIGHDQLLILVFRGTDTTSASDWLTNAKLPLVEALVEGGGGKVHQGFQAGLAQIWEPLLARLSAFRSHQPLLLTGHSLGGALATLAAAELLAAGQPIDGLYTFGAPRVGDPAFTACFNAELQHCTFRLVNHQDWVPHLPPSACGYAHVGQSIYFDETGACSSTESSWLEGVEDLAEVLLQPLTAPFQAHDLVAYRACLQQFLESPSQRRLQSMRRTLQAA